MQILLPRKNSFLIHACGLNHEEQGYLFTGPSGSGKTTIARLSSQAGILSDELIGVNHYQGSWYLYGTPWGTGDKGPVKLTAIFLPGRGNTLSFQLLQPAQAITEIMSNVLTPRCDETFHLLLKLLDEMIKDLPVYRMGFTLNSHIWDKLPLLFNQSRQEMYVTN